MKFLLAYLLSALLVFNPSFAQVIEGKQAQNILAPTNYVRNALAEKAESTADIVDASNILTVSSSSPIEGKKSFNIDATATAQVIKVINDPIQQVLVGQNCEANFSYFGDASLYKAYVEQGGNKLTYTEQTLLNTGSSTQVYRVNFPCGTSIVTNNIVIESTGNGAAIKADKFYSGEATNIINQVITSDWQAYTPTITASSGTLTNFTLSNTEWMRDGQNIYLKGQLAFTGAAGTWTSPRISLPSGITISTTAGTYLVNRVFMVDAGNNSFAAEAFINAATGNSFIEISGLNGGGNQGSVINQSTPFTFNSGDTISWTVGPIKVNQFSGTQSAIVMQCIQDGSCENVFSAKVTSGGVVSDENIDWLNGNCTVGPPTSCTFKAGFFPVAPVCTAHTAFSGSYSTEVFTSLTSTGFSLQFIGNNTGGFTITCTRSGSDYRPRFATPVLTGNIRSNGPLTYRHEGARITNNGTCSIASSTSGFVSTVNVGAGYCDTTVSFGNAPIFCSCNAIRDDGGPAGCTLRTATATSIRTLTRNTADENRDLYISCLVP